MLSIYYYEATLNNWTTKLWKQIFFFDCFFIFFRKNIEQILTIDNIIMCVLILFCGKIGCINNKRKDFKSFLLLFFFCAVGVYFFFLKHSFLF